MPKKGIKLEFLFIIFAALMFGAVSILSLRSIQQQGGNARVVNYAGIVRGRTQKLVKEELRRQPDDVSLNALNTIVEELSFGGPINNLIELPDHVFQENMTEIREKWALLKEQINIVRNGGNDQELYDQSQEYFTLANTAVFNAESYSERQVVRSRSILMGCIVLFIAILGVGVFYVIRMIAVGRRAEALGKLAYIDVLTGLPNRARCERVCQEHDRAKPVENLTVYMFDMNNLKIVNDKLGHQAGDKLIHAFATALRNWADEIGFVGRYGGDEFLAIFDDTSGDEAEEHLLRLEKIVEEYNKNQESKLERISFAGGYRVDNLAISDMEAMILDADRSMYTRKRQMREAMLD
ncbi:GGDEF domain-containing protein [Leadbettera azotonutricia]|uniref:GGDEF domain-containing protein n=1 Tax=Leadbettera azotonutricia TaxID=150829 RepID=UPI0002FAEC0C|nr:GGDEF domain-containing protein [Leadbettera azotonutricia]